MLILLSIEMDQFITTAVSYTHLDVYKRQALLGTLLAYLCIQFITKVNGDEMLQNSVMILSAYMTFVIAQNYLEVSGVIALVGFGLTVSYMGRPRLKPDVYKRQVYS